MSITNLLDENPNKKYQNNTGQRCFEHLSIVDNNLLMLHGVGYVLNLNVTLKKISKE